MFDHVSQCLLQGLESEHGLFQGLFQDPEPSWEHIKDFDPSKLETSISNTIDRLRKRLLEGVAAVARRRNSLLLIQRLPPEILSACIGHVVSGVEPHNHQQMLMRLSAISWWWRQVALSTPSLWGMIHSENPEHIISLALERSKDTPLTIRYEPSSRSKTLDGRNSIRFSGNAEDFFGLVAPHAVRWADVAFPPLRSSNIAVEWLRAHSVQLSRHLRQLTLCWIRPPTDGPITRFTGDAERLLELKLHNLTICPKDIIRTVASSPRIITLDLRSLVASDGPENQAEPVDIPPPFIHLPCLSTLLLKNLPSSILGPILEGINTSMPAAVHIVHDTTTQGNAFDGQDKSRSDSLASFIPRLIATKDWVQIKLSSSGIILKPMSRAPACDYIVELQGMLSALLPWLQIDSLPRATRQYRAELRMLSEGLGDNPGQAVIESLMQFPRVGSLRLEGRTEAWRWIWLLSLPDAVQTNLVGSDKKSTKSWLWPDLEFLHFYGDWINEFTLLSVLLARYGSSSSSGSTSQKEGMPRGLLSLEVRPGDQVWRVEVVDRIRELVGPGRFKWMSRS
ncbi:hypothetical protein FRC05_002782 [Tulasnella sp. 425]|nr:hypothetical protein FRC05_002782 [Tulasnella sp. 425]